MLSIIGAGGRARGAAAVRAGAFTEMAFTLTDSSTGANRPVTLTVPLAEGDVATGEKLVVQKSDGTAIATQFDKITSWRTDSSVLLGMVTFLTPDAGDNTGSYKVVKGTPESGTAVSKAEIAATAFDAVISATIGGTAYSLSASDLLDGTVTPRKDYTYLAGPMMSSYCVGGPLRTSGGTEHSTIQAHFEIRAFKISGAISKVYVTCTLENTGADNTLTSTLASSVDVSIGGTSLTGFPKVDFTIHADCRYTKRGWFGGDPSVISQHPVSHLQATKLVPKYRTVDVSTIASGFPQSTDWNQGNLTSVSPSTGAQPDLAPNDRWTATYLVSGLQTARNAMRAVQDEYQAVIINHTLGLWRPRSESSGHPIDLTVDGRVGNGWGSGADAFGANRDALPFTSTDHSHSPSMGYVMYLTDGEFNDLESCLFSGIAAWINERPGGFVGTVPSRRFGETGQLRALAWELREIVNAGVICPDSHPLRDTMTSAVTNALSECATRGMPTDTSGNTGLWLSSNGKSHDGNPNIAQWQDDWITWAISSAYERGWASELDASGLWTWKAQGVVGRFGTSLPGFCWNRAAMYSMKVSDTVNGVPYESWADIFNANFPNDVSCEASGQPMTSGDGTAVTYGAQIAPALAAAADNGIDGATAAWSLYDARDISGFSITYGSAPEWAIETRSS